MIKEKFEIIKTIEVGLAKELNFIIKKGGQTIYVFSDLLDKKGIIKKYMKGKLHVDFSEELFKKIDTKEKSINVNNRNVVLNLKGEIIEKDNSNIVIDCGFLFNLILRKKQAEYFEVGVYVSIDTPTIWVYGLEPIKKNDTT